MGVWPVASVAARLERPRNSIQARSTGRVSRPVIDRQVTPRRSPGSVLAGARVRYALRARGDSRLSRERKPYACLLGASGSRTVRGSAGTRSGGTIMALVRKCEQCGSTDTRVEYASAQDAAKQG